MLAHAGLQCAKRCYVVVVLLFVALLAHAQWLSADEAARVLNSSYQSRLPQKSTAKSRDVSSNVKLLHTETLNGHNTVYVFGRGDNNGVVLVGGLEGIDILGYTDHGDFSVDNMPLALKALMQSWSEQQNAMASTCGKSKPLIASSKQTAERKPIDHLIQTHWSQYSPYNDKCPEECPTGCVATMYAQLIKYYNYPNRGKGSHSYNWNGQTLSANFGATEYHWDKMLDTYTQGCYDKESGDAVATLMYHVGVACEMKYAEGGSSAISKPDPLVTYFDYNVKAENRRIYGSDEDIQLMYEQLEKRQPIPYSGNNFLSSGHAFIVDGYRDGMWGINWGWGGSWDGYFRLGNFNPGEQNYSSNNYAILNLIPNGSFTPDAQAKPGEFTVTTPGTLKSMLGKIRYNQLTIHGNINGDDLRELRARCSCKDNGYIPTVGGLTSLDLSDANIVDGGVYYFSSYNDEDHPDGYKTKANTLGSWAFYGSLLEELRLPTTVTSIEKYALVSNTNMIKLTLPSDLVSYENSAIENVDFDLRIEVPNGGKPIFKDNALYLQDYKKLCLVVGKHDKFVVDERCNNIADEAFSSNSCKIGTLVLPHIDNQFELWNVDVEKIWLAGTVQQMYLNPNFSNTYCDLYLPSEKFISNLSIHKENTRVNRIYVPQNMLSQYKNSKQWESYSSRIYAIDDIDLCVDDRRMSLQNDIMLTVMESRNLLPLIYDTKIVGKTLEWKSSNTAVATVDTNGKVKALSYGKADITVTVDGITATSHVVVDTWPTVNVDQPGTLTQLIEGKEYTYLRVTGRLNGEDIRELRARTNLYDGDYKTTSATPLEGLDLSDANIVDGGVYYSSYELDNMECVANTITQNMFSEGMISLKTLLLPNSAKKMEYYSIRCCNMQYLQLPAALESFEEGAIMHDDDNVSLDINVPTSSCLVLKDGLLYKNDFSIVYLCISKDKTIKLDPRCTTIGRDAFDNRKLAVQTLIAPNVTSCRTSLPSMTYLWLGGEVEFLSAYLLDNKNLSVFLPYAKNKVDIMLTSSDKSIKALYVSKALIDTYKNDANWSVFAKEINSIEDCGIVLDECRVLIPEKLEIYANTKEKIKVQVLDTRLYGMPLQWTTSNKNVVIIDDNGVLTSNEIGEAYIQLQIGSFTATCHVTVKAWPTIDVQTSGTLAELIGDQQYTRLRVTGNINGADLYKLRYMCGARDISADGYYTSINDNPQLLYLDLKDVNLCKGGTYGSFWGRDYTLDKDVLPSEVFACSKLECLRLPASIKKLSSSAIINNYSLKYLELPEKMSYMQSFVGNNKLETVLYVGTNYVAPDFKASDVNFKNVTLYVRQSLLERFRQNEVYAATFAAIEPIDDKLLNGIDNIEIKKKLKADVIYNVMGQRLTKMKKGINIVNGKKVLIK